MISTETQLGLTPDQRTAMLLDDIRVELKRLNENLERIENANRKMEGGSR